MVCYIYRCGRDNDKIELCQRVVRESLPAGGVFIRLSPNGEYHRAQGNRPREDEPDLAIGRTEKPSELLLADFDPHIENLGIEERNGLESSPYSELPGGLMV